jgi:hypothetical protein
MEVSPPFTSQMRGAHGITMTWATSGEYIDHFGSPGRGSDRSTTDGTSFHLVPGGCS